MRIYADLVDVRESTALDYVEMSVINISEIILNKDDKKRYGTGYETRCKTRYLVVLQTMDGSEVQDISDRCFDGRYRTYGRMLCFFL